LTRLRQLATTEGSRVNAPYDSPRRVDQVITYLWATFQQPYFWAATELWLAARHNPDLADATLPQEKQLYTIGREMVDDAFGPVLTQHRDYETCREMIFTSMRGVALTYAFDKRDPNTEANLRHWRLMARRLLDVDTRQRTP
jgi:hypothetical protein